MSDSSLETVKLSNSRSSGLLIKEKKLDRFRYGVFNYLKYLCCCYSYTRIYPDTP